MIQKNLIICSFGNQVFRENIEELCRKSIEYIFDDSWNILIFNEKTFDVNQFEFTRVAYEKQYYAFVSDFVRLWALYNYGGVYLDTDVLMLKPLDESILDNHCFIGSCIFDDSFNTYSDITSWGIVGAEKHSSFIKELLDKFFIQKYIDNMNTRYMLLMSMTKKLLTKRKLSKELLLSQSIIELDDITVYPFDYFTCTFWTTNKLIITDNSYCIHLFGSSWQTKGLKSKALKRISDLEKRLMEY